MRKILFCILAAAACCCLATNTLFDRVGRNFAHFISTEEQFDSVMRIYDKAMDDDEYDIAVSAMVKIVGFYYEMDDEVNMQKWIEDSHDVKYTSPKGAVCFFDLHLYRVLDCIRDGRYEEAIEFCDHIEQDAHDRRDKYGECLAGFARATILRTIGDIPASLSEYLKALRNHEERNSKEALSFAILVEILDILIDEGNLVDVPLYLSHMKKEISSPLFIDRQFLLQEEAKEIYLSFLLQYYSQSGHRKEAESIFNEYNSIRFMRSDLTVSRAARALFDFYRMRGEYEKAYEVISGEAAKQGQQHIADRIKQADVLLDMKRFEEASNAYTQIYSELGHLHNQSKQNEYHQFSEYIRHGSDEKMRQSEQLVRNHAISILSISILVIIFVAFMLSVIMYFHGKKLQKILQNKLYALQSKKNETIAQHLLRHQVYDSTYNSGRVKAMFLNNMSHEIRTPLNSIKGFSEMIPTFATKPEHLEYAKFINESSSHLISLVNSILELGRMDSGRMKFAFSEFEVAEMCTEAVLGCRPQPGVQMQFNPPRVPIFLRSDRARLQSVLRIVLDNACKFTSTGSITLIISNEEKFVRLTVEDTGMGIPIEKTETIFDRFEKLDSYTQGNGLGLSLARGIMYRLGGRIYVDSSYSAGARFIIKAPKHLTEAVSMELMSPLDKAPATHLPTELFH